MLGRKQHDMSLGKKIRIIPSLIIELQEKLYYYYFKECEFSKISMPHPEFRIGAYSVDSNNNLTGLRIDNFIEHVRNNKIDIVKLIAEHSCNYESLRYVSIDDNLISDVSGLKNFKNLSSLLLPKNDINDISPLSNLGKLEMLDLSCNRISNISVLSNLRNLRSLNLSGNKRIRIISSISSLLNLENLNLSGNNILDISPIRSLNNLFILDLRFNSIKKVPSWIIEYPKMDNILWIENRSQKEQVSICGNPIESPPKEIIIQGENAILRYFKSVKVDNKEVKVIILGNTTAGKSSLVQYLVNRKYPPEKTTHGVSLTSWKPEDYEFIASVWDFGGQEYYHTTHRLFLSNNAIYILLWEESKNKTGIIDTKISLKKGVEVTKCLQHFHNEYWLRLVRNHFAPDSPIISVQNKIDITKKVIICQEHIDKYNIDEQYQISIEETANKNRSYERKFLNFEEEIKELISNFIKNKAHTGESAGKIQRYIASIRSSLREWKKGYLTIAEFKERAFRVALKEGDRIDDFDLEITLKYLHDTGILLYYGYEETMKDSILKKYVFIDPNFVTGKIYKILDEKNVQKNNGRFDYSHVEKVVKSKMEADLFLALMESPNFELIFKYQGYYYASQFLPEINEEIENLKESLSFKFSLKFPKFYSPSFIKRFISRYGIYASGSAFSRTGLILKRDNVIFYVSTDIKKEKITVKTSENGIQHRFIRTIYDTFLEFADGDQNIELSFNDIDFAPLIHIDAYELPEYNIDRLFQPLEYKMNIGNNEIEIHGDRNITFQNVGKNTIINITEGLVIPDESSKEIKQILTVLKDIVSQTTNTPAHDRKNRIMEKIENRLFSFFRK